MAQYRIRSNGRFVGSADDYLSQRHAELEAESLSDVFPRRKYEIVKIENGKERVVKVIQKRS